MEPEWRVFLREHAPKLYEQMLSDVKWDAEWRDKKITELEQQLKQPPDWLLDKWMANELADFKMVMDHCSKIYMHFSGGRISKPNTLPEEVISIAEELEQERFQQWYKEEVDARLV